MYGRIVLSVSLALVCLAGAAGIGMYAYNLGLTQGLASNAKLDVPTTGVAPMPYYGMPFFYRPFGFGWGFDLLGCLVPLFFFFALFSVMRMVFWRARWGGMHHRRWEGGVPPMAEEWHKKMHEQQSSTQKV